MSTTKTITSDDLWLIEDDGYHRYELVNGELRRMPPAGGEHGEIEIEFGHRIVGHAGPRDLGKTYSGDTGFILSRDPDTVVSPDVAFIRKDRLPPKHERIRFLSVPPDLAVEIVSPSDRPSEIAEKVRMYQAAGVPLVWVVDPRPQTITVHELGQPPRLLTAEDELTGGNVLPGFRLVVGELFQ